MRSKIKSDFNAREKHGPSQQSETDSISMEDEVFETPKRKGSLRKTIGNIQIKLTIGIIY